MRDDPQPFTPSSWGRLFSPRRPRSLDLSRPGSAATAPPLPTLTAESERACPLCGRTQRTRLYDIPHLRLLKHLWDPDSCGCAGERIAAAEERRGARERAQAQAAVDAQVGADGLRRVEHLGLASFDPSRLAGDVDTHPYHVGAAWAAQIADMYAAENFAAGPPAALYFYSPTRGCGKTHLAAGLALELARTRPRIAFLDEVSFSDRMWAASLEQKERAILVAGDAAHLTVLDDLGTRAGSPGLADLWYAVINRRWLSRRWLIVTSNYTIDELLAKKTINEATYSRLYQMTRGAALVFDGSDQRRAS